MGSPRCSHPQFEFLIGSLGVYRPTATTVSSHFPTSTWLMLEGGRGPKGAVTYRIGNTLSLRSWNSLIGQSPVGSVWGGGYSRAGSLKNSQRVTFVGSFSDQDPPRHICAVGSANGCFLNVAASGFGAVLSATATELCRARREASHTPNRLPR